MNIATLGTCVLTETIKRASQPWNVFRYYISFSSMAIVDNYYRRDKNQIIINELANSDFLEQEINDINGCIVENIKTSNPDILFLDLCDFRISERIYYLEDGRKLICSARPYDAIKLEKIRIQIEQTYNSRIVDIQEKKIESLSNEELKDYINKFLDIWFSIFGKNKVVILEPGLVTNYIDNDSLGLIPNYRISGNTNMLIKRLYSLIPNDIIYIPFPRYMIGDTRVSSPFEYSYCESCYNYYEKCISLFLSNELTSEKIYELKELCESTVKKLCGVVYCRQIIKKIKVKQMQNDIVLIARTTLFNDLCYEAFGKKCSFFIKYDEKTDVLEIEKELQKIKAELKSFIIVIPEWISNETGIPLLFSLYNGGYRRDIDFYYPTFTFELKQFKGVYEDILGNYIDSKQYADIVLDGAFSSIHIGEGKIRPIYIRAFHGASLVIGGNCSGLNFTAVLFENSKIEIGNAVTFSGTIDIRSHIFSKISIGNDCMFSYDEMIYCGSGHTIYDLETGLAKPLGNDEIKIGEHIWVGYRCQILTSANIGTGCIVGAGSIVNKRFPNNCTIAGVPAKIIKKNTAWSRNPCYRDISEDKSIYNKYDYLTEE